jgi:hypothetical protein
MSEARCGFASVLIKSAVDYLINLRGSVEIYRISLEFSERFLT